MSMLDLPNDCLMIVLCRVNYEDIVSLFLAVMTQTIITLCNDQSFWKYRLSLYYNVNACIQANNHHWGNKNFDWRLLTKQLSTAHADLYSIHVTYGFPECTCYYESEVAGYWRDYNIVLLPRNDLVPDNDYGWHIIYTSITSSETEIYPVYLKLANMQMCMLDKIIAATANHFDCPDIIELITATAENIDNPYCSYCDKEYLGELRGFSEAICEGRVEMVKTLLNNPWKDLYIKYGSNLVEGLEELEYEQFSPNILDVLKILAKHDVMPVTDYILKCIYNLGPDVVESAIEDCRVIVENDDENAIAISKAVARCWDIKGCIGYINTSYNKIIADIAKKYNNEQAKSMLIDYC